MNHIIHSCTHAHVAKDRQQISTAEMFAGMAAYMQQLLDLLEPRCAACCMLCAVCGVLCAVCCVLCAVCSVLCAVCCVLCAVCCVRVVCTA
jgi:heme O synthase-like polyprenyltransferase